MKMSRFAAKLVVMGLALVSVPGGCGREEVPAVEEQPDSEGKEDGARPWWCIPPFCRPPVDNSQSGETVYHAGRAQLTHALTQTSDGGYVLVGESAQSNDSFMAIFVMKVDARGKQQWLRHFDGKGQDAAYDVVALDDGSVVVAGSSERSTPNGYSGDYQASEGRILAIDARGNTLWDRWIQREGHTELRSLARTPEGGFVAMGFTHSVGGGDFLLVRLDARGEILWTRTLGDPEATEVGKSVKVLADGGFVLGGSRMQDGKMKALVVLTDEEGSERGSWTFGDPTRDVNPEALTLTRDGGIVIAGYVASNFFDAPDRAGWVSRIDASGQLLWTREIGGEVWDAFASVAPTADGGVILAGQTRSCGHPNALVNDVLLVKLAADGNQQWLKAHGDGKDNYADAVIQTAQGGYALGVTTMSGLIDFFDASLLRLRASGDL